MAWKQDLPAPCSQIGRLRPKIVGENWKVVSISLAALLSIGFLQVVILFPLHKTMDLPVYDEAFYMGHGDDFLHGGSLGPLALSPLYSLLYSVLISATGRVDSIFCAQYVVKTFVSLMLFWFLSVHLKSRLMASILTMIWIVSSTNVFSVYLSNHFALGLFLLALICIERHRVVALLLLWLCALARLDYLLVFIAFGLYMSWQYVTIREGVRPNSHSSERPIKMTTSELAVASLIAFMIIYVLLHVSDFNLGGQRTWHAFSNFYAGEQVQRGRFNLNKWIDYNLVMQVDFPGAGSLGEAFAVNPREFIRHVAWNIPRLVKSTLWTVVDPYSMKLWLRVIFIVILGFCITNLSLASLRRDFITRAIAAFQRKKILFYAMIICLPVLILSLLVHPIPRYTLVMVPFLLFGLGFVCLESLHMIAPQRSERRFLIALNILFVLIITVSQKPFSMKNPERPIFAEISELNGLLPEGRSKLLGIGSTWYASYLGSERVTPIEPFGTVLGEKMQDRSGDLGALLERYNPDVVLINRELVESPNFDAHTLRYLQTNSWHPCTVGGDSFYFRVGQDGVPPQRQCQLRLNIPHNSG